MGSGSRSPRSMRSASTARYSSAVARRLSGSSPSGPIRETDACALRRPTVIAWNGRSGCAAVSATRRTHAAMRCCGPRVAYEIERRMSPATPETVPLQRPAVGQDRPDVDRFRLRLQVEDVARAREHGARPWARPRRRPPARARPAAGTRARTRRRRRPAASAPWRSVSSNRLPTPYFSRSSSSIGSASSISSS